MFGGNAVNVANGMNLALKQRSCLANVRWNHVFIAKEIEENTRLKAEIENIKAEIRQQQW